MSLSICTSQPWLGYETRNGNVIYITPEGLNGLKKRVQAWEFHHGIEVVNFGYITEAPMFLDAAEIDMLIENIKSSHVNKPVLIIIDTLARHMVGGDENSALNMGEFVANVEKLRAAFDCAVIIIHHTGKTKNKSFMERGSTALRGAADTMFLMEKNQNGIFISCDKQKDSEPFEKIPISLLQTEITCDSNSCVIIRNELSVPSTSNLGAEKEKILVTLFNADTGGLKTKEILNCTGIPESSYHRYREILAKDEYIESSSDQRYILTEKGKKYALTLKTLSNSTHESATIASITPTPL